MVGSVKIDVCLCLTLPTMVKDFLVLVGEMVGLKNSAPQAGCREALVTAVYSASKYRQGSSGGLNWNLFHGKEHQALEVFFFCVLRSD